MAAQAIGRVSALRGRYGGPMELNDLTARIGRISVRYAGIHDIDRSPEWALLKLMEEVGELTQSHLTASGQGRDRGRTGEQQREHVSEELADALGMFLVYADMQGIDLEAAMAHKWLRHEQS